MKIEELTKADKVALKEMVHSAGWQAVMKLYDQYRFEKVREVIDGQDLLEDGMNVMLYKLKYKVQGATEIIMGIADIAEDKKPKAENVDKDKLIV